MMLRDDDINSMFIRDVKIVFKSYSNNVILFHGCFGAVWGCWNVQQMFKMYSVDVRGAFKTMFRKYFSLTNMIFLYINDFHISLSSRGKSGFCSKPPLCYSVLLQIIHI